jgi:hypothetical protein
MRNLRALALLCALTTASTAGAQSGADKLTLHGYLTQGYGFSSPLPILGLNRDPSGDYRAAALQMRYELTPEDNFVVQVASRALGSSPINLTGSPIAVDYAFYAHRFSYATVRVGRIPMPFGFFNETREIGSLTPFYRAPANYYVESIRSIDGASVTNNTLIAGGSLETIVTAGGFDNKITAWTPTSPLVIKSRNERAFSIQMTYNTPIEGVRLVGLAQSFRALDTAKVQAAPAQKLSVVGGGIDATFDRVYVRGESKRLKIGSNSRGSYYYAQTGVRLADGFWVNAQGDFVESSAYNAAAQGYLGSMTHNDKALGASYAFLPNVVGKLEHHWFRGTGIDGFVAPGSPTPYTTYNIASVSLNF